MGWSISEGVLVQYFDIWRTSGRIFYSIRLFEHQICSQGQLDSIVYLRAGMEQVCMLEDQDSADFWVDIVFALHVH